MDVLKLVVEDFGVNMNAKLTERIYRDRKYLPTITRGVLHDLAAGKFWWHVHQALPYLIQMGADVNIQNRDRETPLIVALKSHHPFSKKAFKVLVKAGADVNVADNAGNTCLSRAADDLNIIKLLIAHGPEVSPSAILSALELEKVDLLEILLSQSGQSILRQPLPTQISYGNTRDHFKTVGAGTLPLLYAAAYRARGKSKGSKSNVVITKRLVDVMLKYGADPYATFPHQQYLPIPHQGPVTGDPGDFPVTNATIIHELLSGGHIVEPFFNLPSLDIERRDENGCTLILAASKNESRNLHHGRPNQQIISMDPFAELINRGANVMAQDNEGRTILHHIGDLITVYSVKEALQTAMTANPSLVHQTDDSNETALHIAIRGKRDGLIQFLLDNGADPLQPDRNGDTGLHHLPTFHIKLNTDLFERFLKAGVDINARNKNGETPLFNLLKQDNEGQHGPAEDQTSKVSDFEYFLKSGADVIIQSNDGSTLLHVIAGIKIHTFDRFHPEQAGRVGVVRFKRLMDMGLDPMAEDKRQRTSVDVAAACENELISKLFKKEPME
jgi:ankyrin repeat protein